MVIAHSPYIFQHNVDDLFHGFEFICAFIYELLVLTKGYWKENLQNLGLALNKLKLKGRKFNIEDSFFVHTKMGYLGFWVTSNGIKPI